MKDLKILIADNGTPFSYESPYHEPLGGSETSAILLARGLAELSSNNSVVLLSNTTMTQQQPLSNLLVHTTQHYEQYAEQADIIILNRWLPNYNIPLKPVFYWNHDAFDQKHKISWISEQASNLQNKIHLLFVSEWQRQSYHGIGIGKTFKSSILPNPIDYSLYLGSTKRNPNKLLFASIPYKGLEVLGKLFVDLCFETKKELELHLFSNFALYHDSTPNDYLLVYHELSKLKGVHIHPVVSMKELAYEMCSSSVLLAPCTYHETFGRVFIESLAGGCIPVTVNTGANEEVLNKHGVIVPCCNVLNGKCYTEYVKAICDVLNNVSLKQRENGKQYAVRYDYLKIAQQFLKIIGG